MLNRLKQEWKRDPLTVAALGAVALGFLMWAAPLDLRGIGWRAEEYNYECRNGNFVGDGEFNLVLVRVYQDCEGVAFDFATYWFQFDRFPAVLFFFTLAAFLFWRGTLSRGTTVRRR